MTREAQIKAASAAYTRVKCPMAMGGDRFKNMIDSINANPAFIAGAEWADKNPKSPWISVEDRLPEAEEMVFVSFGDTYVKGVGYLSDDVEEYWYINGWGCIDDVTHWMPIPELPKEG